MSKHLFFIGAENKILINIKISKSTLTTNLALNIIKTGTEHYLIQDQQKIVTDFIGFPNLACQGNQRHDRKKRALHYPGTTLNLEDLANLKVSDE